MKSTGRAGNLYRPLVALLAWISLWAAHPSNMVAWGQDPSAGGLEIAKIEGTLEAIAGDRLKVKGEDDVEYFVVLTNQSTFRYEGTAEAKFLRVGLLVRFNATFDVQKGIAIKPVSDIEIFRPVKQRRMTEQMRQNQTPGIYPVVDKKNQEQRGQNQRAGNPTANAASPLTGLANQEFRVVGQLAVIQPNKIRVQAGPRAIIVDLEPDSKISVAAGDGAFCLPGDQVKVTGLRNAAQANLIKADTVEITGAQTLGAVADGGEEDPASERGGLRQGKRDRDQPTKEKNKQDD